MTVNTNDLVRVNTYAKETGVTPQAVYQWIKDDKVNVVEIDGVKFINTLRTWIDKERK